MTVANAVPAVTLGDELSFSAIGFGVMALTPVYGEVDDAESLATLHRCVELGVTFIDTANVYGNDNNERLIGPSARSAGLPVTPNLVANVTSSRRSASSRGVWPAAPIPSVRRASRRTSGR